MYFLRSFYLELILNCVQISNKNAQIIFARLFKKRLNSNEIAIDKKTNKTPKSEIERAIKIKKEYLKNKKSKK